MLEPASLVYLASAAVAAVYLLAVVHVLAPRSWHAHGPATALVQTVGLHEVVRVRGACEYGPQSPNEGPRNGGKFDSTEIYFPIEEDFGWHERRFVVGWRPSVAAHSCADGTKVELVHHMNVLAVQAHLWDKMQKGDGWTRSQTGGFLGTFSDEGVRFVASYDRGADAFELPAGLGIPIEAKERLVLEYHLLKPHCWRDEVVQEDSGVDLVVARGPLKQAFVFGFTRESLQVEPGHGRIDAVTELAGAAVAWLGQRSSSIEAIHLHTHDLADSKRLELWRGGKLFFRSTPEPTGYGPTQSMQTLEAKGWPALQIKAGDKIRIVCGFDRAKLPATVIDGTSWGEEMCSVLFVATVGGLVRSPPSVLSLDRGFDRSIRGS